MLYRIVPYVALLFIASAAQADVWMGRPTVGDIVRRDLGNVMRAQQELVRSKHEYNDLIHKARERFFATAQIPNERDKVAQEFAKLLFGKDMYYLSNYITNGIGNQEVQNHQMLNMLTGGEIDNGIPKPAMYAFTSWVNAIRLSLGAKSQDQMLVVADPKKLEDALAANLDVYKIYQAKRDRAEFVQRGIVVGEESPPKMAADGGFALRQQGFASKDRMLYFYTSGKASDTLRQSLADAEKNGQKILECIYGAEDRPEVYYFWHKTLPSNISEMRARDRPLGMLSPLGTKGWNDCPESSKSAMAEYQAGQASRQSVHKEIEAERQTTTQANGEAALKILDRNKTERAAPAAVRSADKMREYTKALADYRKRQAEELQDYKQGLQSRNIRGAQASDSLAAFRKQQLEQYTAYRTQLSDGMH